MNKPFNFLHYAGAINVSRPFAASVSRVTAATF